LVGVPEGVPLARRPLSLVAGVLVSSLGCGAPTLAEQHVSATPAVEALRKGSFEDAARRAREVLEVDPQNPQALLVRAIVRYRATQQQLVLDGRTVVIGGMAGGINSKYLRATAEQAEGELAAVEADLAEVAEAKGVSLELCLACWPNVDWTGDGRVDRRDRLLLQIERDEKGEPIPEDDPRRTPTFRFDDGDVAWARAFVDFERAALDLVLAYDWSGVDQVLTEPRGKLVIRLADKSRVAAARQRILDGLGQSDAARRAYLAESDDDREWVPSPRQKSHPMPLPVDQALYDTWAGVVGDLGRLVRGEEGIALTEIADLFEVRELAGVHGYIDVGAMLSKPRDITLDERELRQLDRGVGVPAALRSIFGEYWVERMKPSPLPRRLARMKGEVDAHEEEIEHKLRYLLWLN
jgi:hypothetical protein